LSVMASRSQALALYAHILRLHRQKLPFEMRQLGDAYVGCGSLLPYPPPIPFC
jgi:hypothetical protein